MPSEKTDYQVTCHKAKCAVCKSKDLKEIEQKYMEGIPVSIISRQHEGVEDHTLYRHIIFFDLRAKRFANTLSNVQSLLEYCQNLRYLNKLPATGQTETQCLRLQADLRKETDPNTVNVLIENNLPQLNEITKITDKDKLRAIIAGNAGRVGLDSDG